MRTFWLKFALAKLNWIRFCTQNIKRYTAQYENFSHRNQLWSRKIALFTWGEKW